MIASGNESIARTVREEVSQCHRELDLLAQRSHVDESNIRRAPTKKIFKRLDLQPTPVVPRRIRLRELLKYYDRRFIEFAYRCILNRPMDPAGERYIEQLRRGKSRIDTLLQIRYSREGKSHNTRVRGLGWHYAVYVAARTPVLGMFVRALVFVFRWFWLLVSLPYQQSKQEAWKHYAMSLFTKVEEHMNKSQKQLETAIADLATDRRADVVSPPHEPSGDDLDLELIKNRIRQGAAKKRVEACGGSARDELQIDIANRFGSLKSGNRTEELL